MPSLLVFGWAGMSTNRSVRSIDWMDGTTHPTTPTPHATDQGGARFESGKRPPEDAPLMPKAGAQDFTGTGAYVCVRVPAC